MPELGCAAKWVSNDPEKGELERQNFETAKSQITGGRPLVLSDFVVDLRIGIQQLSLGRVRLSGLD